MRQMTERQIMCEVTGQLALGLQHLGAALGAFASLVAGLPEEGAEGYTPPGTREGEQDEQQEQSPGSPPSAPASEPEALEGIQFAGGRQRRRST